MQYLRFDIRLQLRGRVMTTKLVDVFDGSGAKLFSYSIALEGADCLDAEFEEVALIFAESSGLLTREEFLHLRAACDPCAMPDESPAAVTEPKRTARSKGAVVSLVKHRMKRAGAGAAAQSSRRSLLTR